MNVKDQINNERNRLRCLGVKGNLYIVPIMPKHCFIPCADGDCNCIAKIGTNYCMVDEKGKEKAFKEYFDTLTYLNNILTDI